MPGRQGRQAGESARQARPSCRRVGGGTWLGEAGTPPCAGGVTPSQARPAGHHVHS